MTDASEARRLLAGRHVLLLEENGEQRALQAALNEAGCTVHVRSREESALAALATVPVDLIVLDFTAPRRPGLTLALRLRQRATHPPIVALGRPRDRDLALTAGVSAFVAHPLRVESLVGALAEVLCGDVVGGREALAGEGGAEVRDELVEALLQQVDEAHRQSEARQAQLDRMKNLRHDLLHAIAYELSAPLTPVVGYLQILQGERLGALNERQHQVLASISQGTARMVRTINAITEFASLEMSEYRLARDEVCLKPFLDKVIDLVRFPLAKPKHVSLRLVVREGAPERVVTDARQLGQIVRAQLETAVHRSPSGACVLVELGGDRESLEIATYDQAVAPSADERARMLDPFIPRPRSGRFVFTELELPIARKLAGVLGGKLRLEAPPPRQPDARTRFGGLMQTFAMPLGAHPSPASPPPCPRPGESA